MYAHDFLPHVRRGLDRGNVFQNGVTETDDADDGTGDNAEPAVTNNHGADENVDYRPVSARCDININPCLQMPRPRKENMNDA